MWIIDETIKCREQNNTKIEELIIAKSSVLKYLKYNREIKQEQFRSRNIFKEMRKIFKIYIHTRDVKLNKSTLPW